MRQIVLDTETTGLSAEAGDRIIEIGCVELVNRKLTGRNFHYYLNPERESHEDALKVHGITNEFLLDKPKFSQVVNEFLAYVQDAEIIIHNASFDLGFLNKELALLGLPPFKDHVGQVRDTLAMAKEIYPGKRNSLDALCDRLGVSNAARTLHGALLDAELLADVYIHLTRGQDALLMDTDAALDSAGSTRTMDFSQLTLKVIEPSIEELAAHEEVLRQIDKASGEKTLWRQLSGVTH
jgi:DNA polymerase-3 subunit epsilon